MKTHRNRGPRPSCAHAAEGDGANPKFDRDHDHHQAKAWKDRQLERHAARAIEAEPLSLPQAIDWGLSLAAIQVLRGGSTIRAHIQWEADVPFDSVRSWLAGHEGAARAALARTLNRKRAPVVVLIAAGRATPHRTAHGDHP